MNKLTIGDVAKQMNLNTSAIRYYEKEGLLPEAERRNGRRYYTANLSVGSQPL